MSEKTDLWSRTSKHFVQKVDRVTNYQLGGVVPSDEEENRRAQLHPVLRTEYLGTKPISSHLTKASFRPLWAR